MSCYQLQILWSFIFDLHDAAEMCAKNMRQLASLITCTSFQSNWVMYHTNVPHKWVSCFSPVDNSRAMITTVSGSRLQFSSSLCKAPYHSNVKSYTDLGQLNCGLFRPQVHLILITKKTGTSEGQTAGFNHEYQWNLIGGKFSRHFLDWIEWKQTVVVDRPATQKFRFNKPANNMDNFPQISLFGS